MSVLLALAISTVLSAITFILSFLALRRWLSEGTPKLETLIAIDISANLSLHLFIISLLVQLLVLLAR